MYIVHKLTIKERFLGFVQVEELDALGLILLSNF